VRATIGATTGKHHRTMRRKVFRRHLEQARKLTIDHLNDALTIDQCQPIVQIVNNRM
jgi:hypothetical protein